MFIAALLTPTALMLLVWAAVRNSQRRRAAEADLARLSGGLLQMLETERSRIARELHDDISQQLAVLALELDALGMPTPSSPARSGSGLLSWPSGSGLLPPIFSTSPAGSTRRGWNTSVWYRRCGHYVRTWSITASLSTCQKRVGPGSYRAPPR